MSRPLPPWWNLAAAALVASRDRDYPAVARAAQAIGAQYGDDVIPMVLLAWIDTTTGLCGLRPDGAPVAIRWKAEETGVITDADSTPPTTVWAGRLLGARLADDEATYRALIAACRDDREWGQNVAAVLTMCGAMLRSGAVTS